MLEKDKEQQFLQAYDKYADAIFRYCYYRVFDREKAKDYVQEAYSRIWKYIKDGKNVDNIRALLYKIARNIIIDDSRKSKSSSLEQIMKKGFSPNIDSRQQTEDYLTGKEIILVIKSLEEKYRDVVLMKYVEDLSTKEIAEILGETENNVYVKISRGLEMVREILKKHDK